MYHACRIISEGWREGERERMIAHAVVLAEVLCRCFTTVSQRLAGYVPAVFGAICQCVQSKCVK